MALHEMIKNVKIINELMVYLMDKGQKDIDLKFHLEDKETTIIVSISHPKEDVIRCFKEEIYVERDEELEEYAWELMGENDHSCELFQLGMMIDSIEIIENEDVLTLVMVRKNR